MENLREASRKIQQDPFQCKEILSEVRTTNEEVRSFILSIKDMNPLIIPALIETFIIENSKITVFEDIVKRERVGTIFTCLEDNIDYVYCGFNNGFPWCVVLGEDQQVMMTNHSKIKIKF
jgi:hypothetical protein